MWAGGERGRGRGRLLGIWKQRVGTGGLGQDACTGQALPSLAQAACAATSVPAFGTGRRGSEHLSERVACWSSHWLGPLRLPLLGAELTACEATGHKGKRTRTKEAALQGGGVGEAVARRPLHFWAGVWVRGREHQRPKGLQGGLCLCTG